MEFLFLLIFTNLAFVCSNLPDYIHICKRSDPDINACVLKSIEDLRPNLIAGMTEMNVPSIEPLIINEPIETDGTGIKVVTKNLKAFGGSNYTVTNMDVDPLAPRFNFHVSFPHLKIDGLFDVDGKIIMISFKGSGEITADVYGVDSDVIMECEIIKHGDEEYLSFHGLDLKHLKISKGHVHVGNLFDKEDKLIGDVLNSAINLNFHYFIQELKPTIVSTLTKFAVKTANSIMSNVPLKELFPE